MKNPIRLRPVIVVTLVLVLMLTACLPFLDTGIYSSTGEGRLGLRFHTDRSSVAVGETVRMSFTIVNESNQPIVMETTDLPVMDIRVVDGVNNDLLLSWAKQHPDQVSHHLEWKPGESKTIELTWTAAPDQASRNAFLSGVLGQGSQVVQGVGGMLNVHW